MTVPQIFSRSSSTLILGLGNPLMSDDAVGLEALKAFVQVYETPEEVDIVDGGTLGFELLNFMCGYRRILIVDCICTGRQPGTLMRIEGNDVPALFSQCLSAHQVGLKDLVALMQLQGCMPEAMTVLGIEPENVEMGLELSGRVHSNLPRLVETMAREIERWGVALVPRAPKGKKMV